MSNTHILLVEDERIVAEDIRRTLEDLGYIVCAMASSGEDAIQKVEEHKPDLILMDIVIKGNIDGIEAADEIRSRFSIPIIYLTSYADDLVLERAKLTEPFGYIIKPFEDKELHTAIKMALYKSLMENRLRESREWLYTTLRSIGDAVIATDNTGRIKLINPIAQELTGYSNADAVGMNVTEIFDIVNEHTSEKIENPIEKVLRKGVIVGMANHTVLISKDGTRHIIDDSGAPITDNNGDIIGVVLIFRDVTHRRKMEEELEKMRKLESLGTLAGGIAHDFNNLLTAILGNISLAKINAEGHNSILTNLGEAEKACSKAKDLTQQLLTFSRGGAPIKKTTSIQDLIKDSTSFILTGSNVKCVFDIPEDLWPVEIDQGQISQVINNLIINARETMANGGTIETKIENTFIEADDNIPLKEGMYVKLSIKDYGIGISPKDLPKIFDPYFSSKGEGRGLGLSSTYSIIKNHDGLITVESEPGVGTTFVVTLPASQKQAEVDDAHEARLHHGKGRVMVMDDEQIIRDLVKEMLSLMSYEVICVKDGDEAIEMYKTAIESGRPINAVIMDLTIPGGMGGKDAIKKLLKIDPDAKAIVSSGYSNDPVMSTFQEYGFQGYVCKPYNIQELGAVIEKVIGEN
ncbi:MAG: response regulator [Desulfobacterales bacterium]|nr:response regulator [Desulfobacterales bacterium]